MPQSHNSIEGDLAAHACRRVPIEDLGRLRHLPGLTANFLRHADEQTVVCLAAVFDAIERAGLPRDGFADWGVVAGPRFIGRTVMAHLLVRLQHDGVRGVLPRIIPHRSLHSTPGTISQALKLHGPNLGVGGGPGCEAETLLAGMALLYEAKLPGVWIVFSRLDPEGPADSSTGELDADTYVHAAALAITPVSASTKTILEIGVGPASAGAELSPALLEGILTRLPASAVIAGLGRLSLKPAARSHSFIVPTTRVA